MAAKKPVMNFFMEVNVPMYFRRIIAFYGDLEGFKTMSEELFDEKIQWLNIVEECKQANGFCVPMVDQKGSFELIFIDATTPKAFQEEVIWHECFHATVNILTGIGANINATEQEPGAYLQGYIATSLRAAIKDMQKNKSKVNSEAQSESVVSDSETPKACRIRRDAHSTIKRNTAQYSAKGA